MRESEAPLISVCIPVYNGENFIRESIESVLQQTENNFELLVVDNCSIDDTLNIVAGNDDVRIRVFKNNSNLGSIRNFNRCIELAQAKYLVLLPHDDLLIPTALEAFVKPLISDPQIGLAYSSYYIIDEKGKQTNHRVVDSRDKIMSSEEAIQEFIIHGNPIQCAMVRREVFEHVGLFDPSLLMCSDIDLWFRIVLNGYKAAYFRTPQNCYRVRPDSGTQAFVKRNEHASAILADHLKYKPNDDFIRNNHFSSVVFRHLRILYNRIPINSDIQNLRPLSANWIFETQFGNVIKAMELEDWSEAKQDLGLFIRILRWAGVRKMWPELKPMLKIIKNFVYHFSSRKIHGFKSRLKIITKKGIL